ncbi:photosystem II reaction center protein Psb28 [Nodosilinea sp. E11]|uniref:photosystem II reaction center protein Psb28 n=1 Tax=Nodosilinea sp. E11 TaxID=3037479 RepID=UPI002934552A|nr:photosystem II reaction center protein Psb28 [Nodosilinea sp. E11]WOD40085.1 photosystem II reaction center protein Psb28 [Nodosilinea sp. E11]
MAEIQFARGIAEPVIPDVRLTRAKDGSDGTATFYFDYPQALSQQEGVEITGMYLVDEEGELVTRDVNGKFINGEPAGIEAIYVMKSEADWDRFMRFMNRYAEQNGLGFTKS